MKIYKTNWTMRAVALDINLEKFDLEKFDPKKHDRVIQITVDFGRGWSIALGWPVWFARLIGV